MGSDCSLRQCPFGKSHVTTPLGDMDGSNSIEGIDTLVIEGSTVYPHGVTEAFPDMSDTAGNALIDTAHEYAECSNKGLCDRLTGMCECLPGYDGAACNRASCPSARGSVHNPNPSTQTELRSNLQGLATKGQKSSFTGRPNHTPMIGMCSGHGTCESIADLAEEDGGNRYALWDHDVTMACKCDPGYGGPDCHERLCLHNIDPLYTDDATARVTHTAVRFETTSSSVLSGEYALVFYDTHGEDYITDPLPLDGTGVIDGVDHCDYVVAAFKALPNGVVPDIECTQTVVDTNRGIEYELKFLGNPGLLKEIEILEHLDGKRSTILDASTGHPFGDGELTMGVATTVNGEAKDYFPTRCEGLTVKVLADSSDADDSWNVDVRPGSLGYLTGPDGDLTPAEAKTLKRCLGDSDWDPENNVDVANWDKGFVVEADGAGPTTYNMIGAFPHAIKVVPTETAAGYDKFTYGQYYLVFFDESAAPGKEFRVANLNNGANTRDEAVESYVYTSTGVVQQLGWGDEAAQEIADNSSGGASSTRITGYFNQWDNKIYTSFDSSCDNNPDSGDRNHRCVQKGDMVFLVDGCWGEGDQGAGTVNAFHGGPALSSVCVDSTAVNYGTGNVIYTVKKVTKLPLAADSTTDITIPIDVTGDPTLKKYANIYEITLDKNIKWDGSALGDAGNNGDGTDANWAKNAGLVQLFHFTPPSEESGWEVINYVEECSGRGNCDPERGVCNCFQGYAGSVCEEQDALAGVQMIASRDPRQRLLAN